MAEHTNVQRIFNGTQPRQLIYAAFVCTKREKKKTQPTHCECNVHVRIFPLAAPSIFAVGQNPNVFSPIFFFGFELAKTICLLINIYFTDFIDEFFFCRTNHLFSSFAIGDVCIWLLTRLYSANATAFFVSVAWLGCGIFPRLMTMWYWRC